MNSMNLKVFFCDPEKFIPPPPLSGQATKKTFLRLPYAIPISFLLLLRNRIKVSQNVTSPPVISGYCVRKFLSSFIYCSYMFFLVEWYGRVCEHKIICFIYRIVHEFSVQWKGTGEFVNTKFFCRVCTMLHHSQVSRENREWGSVWERERVKKVK